MKLNDSMSVFPVSLLIISKLCIEFEHVHNSVLEMGGNVE